MCVDQHEQVDSSTRTAGPTGMRQDFAAVRVWRRIVTGQWTANAKAIVATNAASSNDKARQKIANPIRTIMTTKAFY